MERPRDGIRLRARHILLGTSIYGGQKGKSGCAKSTIFPVYRYHSIGNDGALRREAGEE
jgi:hypothetical protein